MAARKLPRRFNTLPLQSALHGQSDALQDLAVELGYDPAYAKKVMRGQRPTQRFARDVARHLGWSVSELFGVADDQPVTMPNADEDEITDAPGDRRHLESPTSQSRGRCLCDQRRSRVDGGSR